MTDDKIIEIAYEAGLGRVVYVHKDGTRSIEMPRLDLLKRFAALVQQVEPVQEPVAYTTGHCENHKQKGGCQPLNQCGETCERAKLCATCARALDQQDKPVEPVEPVAWECKAGGLKPLTQRQYDAQTAATKRHYTRIAPPNQEPVAWMYKGEPWFDGDSWHETYETTTDKTLAYFKDKNARALCFVEK